MGLIEIEGMDFFAYHGCFKEERVIGTRFIVDACLTTDTAEAEISDELKHTVNYQAVYALIRQEMEQHAHLLEHVARRIIDAIYRDFSSVTHVKVKVSKLNPALAHGGKIKQVSITLER
jgi:dihydroneopterin aldolase